jgi:hypothetical protein
MTSTARAALVLSVLVSLGLGKPADDPARRQLLERHAEAVHLLEEAALSGEQAVVARLLGDAAGRLDVLAAATLLPATERKELQQAAAALRARAGAPAAGSKVEETLALLERVGAILKSTKSLGLSFQGSYSQTKVEEPVYGGHASAMGPPPAAAPKAATGLASPVQFEEVPGLTEKGYCGGPTKDHILESGGSGIALFDYDNDGRLDVYAVTAYELDEKRRPMPHENALYRNLGGFKFENVSKRAGVDAAAWGNGVCAADFDGDGLLDLYVTNWGPNFLFRNTGNGTFTDVAAAAGVQADGWSTGCSFFDANGDGLLDLYLARYATATWGDVEKAQRTMTWRGGPKVMVGPVGIPGGADVFYENRGDGTFAEATDVHGLADAAKSYGFGVLSTDYDDDGWTDLFVANDSNPNFLYHNRGDGRFESVGLLAGVALNAEARAQAGMGIDGGDYDGDGLLDFVLTTFAHDNKTIYRNLGGGQFEDVSKAAAIAAPTFEPMGWGVAFTDVDLDGKLDLFFANGHIYPNVDEFPDLKESFRQKNQLLLNDGGTFRDVSESAGGGLQLRRVGRGLAVGDIDNDGDPDAVVSNIGDVPTLLENRQRTGHHWIGLQLKKAGTNPFCIGARVTVEAGGKRQMREVRSGGSYLSQSDLRALFGLGREPGPVNVEVRLGRERWRFSGLAVDRHAVLELREENRLSAAGGGANPPQAAGRGSDGPSAQLGRADTTEAPSPLRCVVPHALAPLGAAPSARALRASLRGTHGARASRARRRPRTCRCVRRLGSRRTASGRPPPRTGAGPARSERCRRARRGARAAAWRAWGPSRSSRNACGLAARRAAGTSRRLVPCPGST